MPQELRSTYSVWEPLHYMSRCRLRIRLKLHNEWSREILNIATEASNAAEDGVTNTTVTGSS
jgi:hypothetical protein